MSGIKGFPTSQKAVKGIPSLPTEFATLQPQDLGLRAGLDTVPRFAFRVDDDTVPRTAQASTGNPDQGPTVVYDTATPARVGDFVRFEDGAAARLEVPIVEVSTNSFKLACRLPDTHEPKPGDAFFIMRYATQRVTEDGAQVVTVNPGPVAFVKDGLTRNVEEDTGTPANSIPLPIKALDGNGVEVDFATEAKQDDIISELQDIEADVEAAVGELQDIESDVEAAVSELQAANSELQSIESELQAVNSELDSQTTLLTSISNKDFATETTLQSLEGKDFATETTLQSLEGKDFATETTLQSLEGKDFATETTLQALEGKDFATETTLQSLEGKDFATETTLAKIEAKFGDLGQQVMDDSAPVVIASDQSPIPTQAPVNSAGSSPGSTTVSTVATITAPSKAVGFILMNLDTSTANIRWRIGDTATASSGQQLQPGRDTGFVPCGANISICAESGTQDYDIQWILQS